MSELTFEVFISLTFLAAGLLTYSFRNKRNYLIGFRIGYTYMSDRAWRETNTFAGLFMMVFSVLLLGLALAGIGILAFILIMLAGGRLSHGSRLQDSQEGLRRGGTLNRGS
ncbi:SdpI family protein [Thermococcus peptonophilus]|uniref:SdpI family protein n=1 Tax=Thermococcus peptonophilus TaxID=53952 RepID=UPI000B21B3B2